MTTDTQTAAQDGLDEAKTENAAKKESTGSIGKETVVQGLRLCCIELWHLVVVLITRP